MEDEKGIFIFFAFPLQLTFVIDFDFCNWNCFITFASSQRGALKNELRSYPTNLEQVMLF